MDEIIKKKVEALLTVVYHIAIPLVFVLCVLSMWNNSISNDASMDWNLFVSISCFGAGILMILTFFFIEWIVDKYYWQVVSQFKEEK